MLPALLRRLLLLIGSCFALALAGCSIPTPPTQTLLDNTDEKAVEQHQQQLNSIFRWQLSARMAITRKRTDQRDGLYLKWNWQRQPSAQQTLRFSHPLKGQLARLTISDTEAVLDADGQQFQDRSAERLLDRVLGVRLPVEALSQWVLGKTTESLQQRAFIAGGRIARAQVTGPGGHLWSIQWFYREDSANDRPLPRQIHLESNQLQVKMQLNDWQTSPTLAHSDDRDD